MLAAAQPAAASLSTMQSQFEQIGLACKSYCAALMRFLYVTSVCTHTMWKTTPEFSHVIVAIAASMQHSRSTVRYSIQSAAACTASYTWASALVQCVLIGLPFICVLYVMFCTFTFPGICQSVTTAATSTCCWSGTQAKCTATG